MPAEPLLEPLADGSGYRIRIRCGKTRNRYQIPTSDPVLAAARATELEDIASSLAGQPPEAAQRVLLEAAAADGAGLERIRVAVARLAVVPVKPKAENPRRNWTIKDLGGAWTSG